MSENNTIARPYAQAIFELAREHNGYTTWSDALGFLSAVASDHQMKAVLDSPRLTEQMLTDLFLEICGDQVDEAGKNFVRLLAENRRLAVLPEIAELYEEMRRVGEGVVRGQVISAYPVSEQQQQQIAAALRARLGREVELEWATDESLIGGAIVRAGDLVIDGSVQGKLNRLANVLSH
jgi:F-type H+-transporting ATPase subunit delta